MSLLSANVPWHVKTMMQEDWFERSEKDLESALSAQETFANNLTWQSSTSNLGGKFTLASCTPPGRRKTVVGMESSAKSFKASLMTTPFSA
jgi:hypothetical protein